jgi:hypothetical protein
VCRAELHEFQQRLNIIHRCKEEAERGVRPIEGVGIVPVLLEAMKLFPLDVCVWVSVCVSVYTRSCVCVRVCICVCVGPRPWVGRR